MNMYKIVILLLFVTPAFCFAQKSGPSDNYEKKYEWRIKQEVLYGVYIPKDVNEAVLALAKLTDEKSKAAFKSLTEEEASKKLFFSLGRWMSYNWSFYEGSRLSVHLQSLGIHHPDDMSRFLTIVFHRSLCKKPLEIKELIKQFTEKEEKAKEEKLKGGTILFQEKRKVTKPPAGKNGQR